MPGIGSDNPPPPNNNNTMRAIVGVRSTHVTRVSRAERSAVSKVYRWFLRHFFTGCAVVQSGQYSTALTHVHYLLSHTILSHISILLSICHAHLVLHHSMIRIIYNILFQEKKSSSVVCLDFLPPKSQVEFL
jgi:uncharacterized protein VirK/YbjX